MQGQRVTIDCFSEVVDIRQGSASNSTGMSQQASLNNTLNPVESSLSNYLVSSAETSLSSSSHDVPSFSGWSAGESSSRMNQQSQVNDDGMKVEHSWSSSFDMHSGAGPRLEEGQIEAANVLFPGRVNIGFNGSRVRSGPLFMQGSSSSHVPQNVNLSAGYVDNSMNSGQVIGSGVDPNVNKSSAVEVEQISGASGSSHSVGTSSGNHSYIEDNTGGAGSSLGTWGLSCKRKALEGTSGHSYPGGTSNSSSQAENLGWHTGPARHGPSNSLFTPSQNSSNVIPGEPQNLSIGIGIRGEDSNEFPPLIVTRNAETVNRNFDRRRSSGNQQEAVALNLSSRIRMASQSARSIPFSDPPDLRPAAQPSASQSGPQSQSHARHVPGMSGNVHPFHWNGGSSLRVGNMSSSLNAGERGPALREEVNLRSVPRNIAEHPMFVPPSDIRNPANDPTGWSLAPGNLGNSGPSTSRIGSSSSVHMLPNPTWLPRQNPPPQNQQRLSEFPWSLFSSIDSEYGGRSGHFTSLPPGPSTSSQDTAMSSGSSSQGHHQQYPRSAYFMERQSDDVLGIPHSLRSLAVDIEGRRRLISEIRQVLSAMRRGGENLRVEDYMPFDPFIYHGLADMHDRHRDMRLDVDNMSYEELLALEERIGDVSTGLSEEAILKLMKQQKYFDIATGSMPDLEPCCICQEEYADGDDLGALDCGHDFHTDCIKQWLMQKNLCPICKTTALSK